RRERVLEPRRPSLAPAEVALEPVEPVALAPALVLVDDLGRFPLHLVGRRPDVDLDPAGDPVAQIAVEVRGDLAAHLVRRADDESLHEALLEDPEELVGGVLQVVLGLLLDPALVSRLRPAALVVPAVDVVDDARDLAHLIRAPAEDAR